MGKQAPSTGGSDSKGTEEQLKKAHQTPTFAEELRALINKHSLENGSDTPDYILASFLANVLTDWNHAVKARDRHVKG